MWQLSGLFTAWLKEAVETTIELQEIRQKQKRREKMKKINLMTIFLFLGFIAINVQSGLAQQPNPSQQDTNEWKSKGTCSDPWVSRIVSQVNASVRHAHTSNGSDGECDVTQYNNGRWTATDQLYKAVDKRRDDLNSMGAFYDSYKSSYFGKALFFLEKSSNKIIQLL